MRKLIRYLIILAIPIVTFGQEYNFTSPPQFSDGIKPQWLQEFYPAVRAEWLTYLDIALLLLAMGVTAWLLLKKRSRNGVFVVMLLSLLYFGFYRHGCICSIGAIQNVAMSMFNPSQALPVATLIFFLAPLVFTLFYGRVFCAGVCPLGALQDLVQLKPLQLPRWLEQSLGIIPFIYLGLGVLYAATGSVFLICQYDPFVAFFRLSGTSTMLIGGAVILAIGTVVGRPYCRFLCPYSALLRILGPLARWRVRITPTECIQCHLCADACPYNAINPPTPEPTVGKRAEGKKQLALLLVLLPMLIVGGSYLGRAAAPTLAQLDRTVYTANLVRQEIQLTGHITRKSYETYAYARTGKPASDIYKQAADIHAKFLLGSTILGGYLGLVFGATLLGLAIRRRRVDYETDPARCLACGRCYDSCPFSHVETTPDEVSP